MKSSKALPAAAAGLLLCATATAQPFGIDTRQPNTTLLIESLPPEAPAAGSFNVVETFTNLTFTAPLFITDAPDGGTDRLFVVEQPGTIAVFDRTNPGAGATDWLDISGRLRSPFNGGGFEEGLLGLAFSPDFATSGEFYVYYSVLQNPRRSRISRFTAANPASGNANPNSEEILLEFSQPFANHNGGHLTFGPDGMLYILSGDGGSGGDPAENAQNTTNLLGTVIRIDVTGTPDPGLAYAIPPDNPFVGGGPAGVNTREEIWAYGLRNPWRATFDMQNGTFYIADVGQNNWEEISIGESGGNFGWDCREGAHDFEPNNCAPGDPLVEPIAEYSHSLGNSITGGYVYYGSEFPELYGQYLYGDYGSGRIWRLEYDPQGGIVTDGPVQIASGANGLTSFGQTRDGEVFLVNGNTGKIMKLERDTGNPVGTNPVPQRLSDIPALLAAGMGTDQTDDGIIPYEPASQLWSDNADKSRFMALPGLDQAGYQEFDGWDFSEDAVIIKNFVLPLDERDPENTLQRVETRILTVQDGDWHGFSYEWNEAGTDATLLATGKSRPFTVIDEAGNPVNFNWDYPSRTQCFQCHTQVSNITLGIQTPQLNSDFGYPASGVTDNQLRTLDHISLLESPGLPDVADNLPKMPDYNDDTAPLAVRAKAYLAANCSMCHRPGGGGRGGMDLRWETPLASMGILDVQPLEDLGIADARYVAPGEPDKSVIITRMESLDPEVRMPPLGSHRVDENGVALLRQWIEAQNTASVDLWGVY